MQDRNNQLFTSFYQYLSGSLDCAVSWSLSGEAESGSAQLKMWNSNNVETSFPLTNRDGLLDWPGCGSVKPYLDRENISQPKIHGLAEIFDKIDAILSVSSQFFLKKKTNNDPHICRKPRLPR